MPIQAVVFDLYDTLIEITEKRKSFRQLLQSMKDHRARSVFVHLFFTNNCHQLEKDLSGANQFDKQTIDHFISDLEAELASVSLFHDTVSTMQEIKNRGLKIGVISNLATAYKVPFFSLGIDKLVDEVMFSCDVGWVKPNRLIYIAMCRKLGFSPENILMVGDSFTCDYQGPSDAGLQSVLLDRKGNSRVEEKISSLSEVLQLL